MVRAEAPAAMRAAVMTRLEARQASGRLTALLRPAVYAAMAAGVAAAIGIWASLPAVREQPPLQQAGSAVLAPGPAAVRPAGSEPAVPEDAAAAFAPATADRGAGGRHMETGRTAAGAVRRTAGARSDPLPRLAVLEPIVIELLSPPPIGFEDIGVAPMGDVPAIEIPGLNEVLPDKGPADPHQKEQ